MYPYIRATASNKVEKLMDFAEELLKLDHNFSMTKILRSRVPISLCITSLFVTTKILEIV